MLCCHCKKNQAIKTHEKTIDGKKQTEYYCLDCYHRLFISAEEAEKTAGGQIAMCPYCGTSEEDFRVRGRVGCAQCYQYLAGVVLPVVIRMQGDEAHCGKRREISDEREEMISRRNFLQNRVEEYMRAKDYAAVKKCSEELKKLKKALYEEDADHG